MAARASAALLLALWCAPLAYGADPPAPDYADPSAWAAWPGQPSEADSIAPGLPDAALSESQKADVFFIHPTTYLSADKPNARYDEPGSTHEQIDTGVLRFQASVFNACCRIYAPRYRQAALRAFTRADERSAARAFELAYGDLLRAFDYYLRHENHGRPFLIASHSQGSLHAMRLLQERIAGQPLAKQLVVAYVVGYYVPLDIGLAPCASALQTGCFVVWNTVKVGASDSRRERTHLIWADRRYQPIGNRALTCTNPLSWTLGGRASPDLNLGALPAVAAGSALRAVVPKLTGAQCDGAALRVDIPLGQRRGFSDVLSFFGSYHIFDYAIFYTNIRVNARQRILAWRSGGNS
jgi:Protein of unknown function (DUF3089)